MAEQTLGVEERWPELFAQLDDKPAGEFHEVARKRHQSGS